MNGDGTHAGFVATNANSNGSEITIDGCVFDGKIVTNATNNTSHCAGFVGWKNRTVTITNSVYAPATISSGETEVQAGTGDYPSATFVRNGSAGTNCYYTRTLASEQGKKLLNITAGQYVTINKGASTPYNISGITAYATGIDYNGRFYAGNGNTLSLSHDARDEYYTFSRYTTNSGSISGNTLTVGNADTTVNAVYNENFYTATWKNYDNSTLATSKVLKGNTPKYPLKDEPTRLMDNYYIYKFSGWDKELTVMTGDTAYTAQYSARDREWLVLWENYNGEILSISVGKYDDQHTYNGTETPTRTGDAQYSYEFTGWSDKTTNIYRPTNDYQELALCYIAQYRQVTNKYTVTWVDGDGNTTTQSVEYGTTPTAPANPAKTGNAQYSYTFTGWDKDITAVTGDITYTAQFTETTNSYTVIWLNYDGTELEKDENVEYGTMPEYNGTTPAKTGNAQYSYTFSGWDKGISSVAGDVTYTAQFTETTNSYTVIWLNYDGTEIEKDENVEYGTMPEYNGTTPTKADEEFYTYTFSGWNKEITTVTGNVTYTAQFKETPKYTGSVTVCDGTNIAYNIPYSSNWNYSISGSDQIYPSTMLAGLTGKNLYSMTFYSSDDVETDVKGMQVYLAEVDFSALPDKYAKAENGVINLYDVDSNKLYGSKGI